MILDQVTDASNAFAVTLKHIQPTKNTNAQKLWYTIACWAIPETQTHRASEQRWHDGWHIDDCSLGLLEMRNGQLGDEDNTEKVEGKGVSLQAVVGQR